MITSLVGGWMATETETKMDLEKIKAIRERNRVAMEAENAVKAAVKAEEDAAEARRQARIASGEGAAMLVQMVDLVLGCPGRPLPAKTVAKLNDIRNRNSR